MNSNLITKEVATINSKEVAEMMETRHDSLIRKIEGINKDFREHKIVVSEYWIESIYKTEGNNKTYKCYEVTKMGCEFLAHKSTGTKGNIFTARYMQKFNEMEKALQNVHIESYRIEDPIERAKKWIEEETVRREQAKLIEEQTPKVEVYDNFVDKEHTLGFRELRKELESTLDITINENRFKDVMREYNLIGKRVKATAFAIRNGFAATKDVDLVNGGTTTQDRFTMKTRDLLLERYRNN